MGGTKGATDKITYLTRTGNHGTKPKKTGDNTSLAERSWDVGYTAPVEADNHAQALKIQDEIEQYRMRIKPIEEELKKINKRLEKTLPQNEFRQISAFKKDLGTQHQELLRKVGELRREWVRVAQNPRQRDFCEAFVSIAKRTLPRDVFLTIAEEVRRALNVDEK